jgi:mannose-6-phosphate isomerase-like protein (cupin superfamily)
MRSGAVASQGGPVAATKQARAVRGRQGALAALRDEDCSAPHTWSNGPGDTYGWHSHGYHKVLFCLSGSIVFHTREGDVELDAGDRLDLGPGTDHAATVGPSGVECLEAER